MIVLNLGRDLITLFALIMMKTPLSVDFETYNYREAKLESDTSHAKGFLPMAA